MAHDAVLQEIRRLDPLKDHQRIAYLTSLQEFPWDTTRSCSWPRSWSTATTARGARLRSGGINQMHGRHPISNDEFLYVLSTFVFEPIRRNERFGWRPLLPQKKLASFYFWREIARRMAIRDVPEDYGTFERYYHDFALQEYRYAPENGAWPARRGTCS
ncbi:MAG: oxygenase MpaB family protein [Chloroflexota bacterium]